MAKDTKAKPRRSRGRRAIASPKTAEKFERQIKQALETQEKHEEKAQEQRTKIAHLSDEAQNAGVSTGFIADILGLSRQMVYKLIRERVYGETVSGQPIERNGKEPARKASKASGKKKAAPKSKAKAKPKAAAKAKAEPTGKVRGFGPAKKKGKAKGGSKPRGRMPVNRKKAAAK